MDFYRCDPLHHIYLQGSVQSTHRCKQMRLPYVPAFAAFDMHGRVWYTAQAVRRHRRGSARIAPTDVLNFRPRLLDLTECGGWGILLRLSVTDTDSSLSTQQRIAHPALALLLHAGFLSPVVPAPFQLMCAASQDAQMKKQRVTNSVARVVASTTTQRHPGGPRTQGADTRPSGRCHRRRV